MTIQAFGQKIWDTGVSMKEAVTNNPKTTLKIIGGSAAVLAGATVLYNHFDTISDYVTGLLSSQTKIDLESDPSPTCFTFNQTSGLESPVNCEETTLWGVREFTEDGNATNTFHNCSIELIEPDDSKALNLTDDTAESLNQNKSGTNSTDPNGKKPIDLPHNETPAEDLNLTNSSKRGSVPNNMTNHTGNTLLQDISDYGSDFKSYYTHYFNEASGTQLVLDSVVNLGKALIPFIAGRYTTPSIQTI